MAAMSARVMMTMMVVVVVVVMPAMPTVGGPGWRTAGPAALGWGCAQGPPWASLRHQRVAEADTRGTLATKGTIFLVQVRLPRRREGQLWSTAEPQLRHGVAVGGPSQKVRGLLGACSWPCLRAGAFGGGLWCPLRSSERGCGGCEWGSDNACAPATAARAWDLGL